MANPARGEVDFAGGVLRFNTDAMAAVEAQAGMGYTEAFSEMGGSIRVLRICLTNGWRGPGNGKMTIKEANAIIDREGVVATVKALEQAVRLAMPDVFADDAGEDDAIPLGMNPGGTG